LTAEKAVGMNSCEKIATFGRGASSQIC
jgi:hypothetical protein